MKDQILISTFGFPVVLFIMLFKVDLTSECATIQMKAIEQYFPVVLFIKLYKTVLTFGSLEEILTYAIQMNSIKQYFPMVLLITLYKVILTIESVDKSGYSHQNTRESLFGVPHPLPLKLQRVPRGKLEWQANESKGLIRFISILHKFPDT